ncbi:MAG: voltage-gated potassium channel [Enterobacterales bacterium]
MQFTFQFIQMFGLGIYYAAPLMIFFILMIMLFGLMIGNKEGWSKSDALYYSFITATTVGYGDFRPETNFGKFMAVCIAFIGLLLTGIFVALGVKAASIAFQALYQIPTL